MIDSALAVPEEGDGVIGVGGVGCDGHVHLGHIAETLQRRLNLVIVRDRGQGKMSPEVRSEEWGSVGGEEDGDKEEVCDNEEDDGMMGRRIKMMMMMMMMRIWVVCVPAQQYYPQ